MKTLKLDLHGHNPTSALLAVENFIASAFEIPDYLHLKLITGNGKIKKMILDYLEEEEYEYFIPLNNEGVIVVEIPEDI